MLIAVVDSGWDSNDHHPRVVQGAGFVGPDAFIPSFGLDTSDACGHGTMCIRRVLTMTRSAKVAPIKILDNKLEASGEQLIAGLQHARRLRVDVVCLSLTYHGQDVAGIAAACNDLIESGAMIVASADSHGGPSYPACLAHVIGVRAGPMKRPDLFEFDSAREIECVAHGSLKLDPRSPGSWNSLATATMAGLIGALQEDVGPLTPSRVRQHLSVHPNNTFVDRSSVVAASDQADKWS